MHAEEWSAHCGSLMYFVPVLAQVSFVGLTEDAAREAADKGGYGDKVAVVKTSFKANSKVRAMRLIRRCDLRAFILCRAQALGHLCSSDRTVNWKVGCAKISAFTRMLPCRMCFDVPAGSAVPQCETLPNM